MPNLNTILLLYLIDQHERMQSQSGCGCMFIILFLVGMAVLGVVIGGIYGN